MPRPLPSCTYVNVLKWGSWHETGSQLVGWGRGVQNSKIVKSGPYLGKYWKTLVPSLGWEMRFLWVHRNVNSWMFSPQVFSNLIAIILYIWHVFTLPFLLYNTASFFFADNFYLCHHGLYLAQWSFSFFIFHLFQDPCYWIYIIYYVYIEYIIYNIYRMYVYVYIYCIYIHTQTWNI